MCHEQGYNGPKSRRAPRVSVTESEHVNEIHLQGRLAASPLERLLPSGDAVVTFRLVVSRPPSYRRGQTGRQTASVDTIECSAWGAALRRKVAKWGQGDVITVDGALRRRFWQAQGGARSRYDVEVRRASRVRRALTRAAACRARHPSSGQGPLRTQTGHLKPLA